MPPLLRASKCSESKGETPKRTCLCASVSATSEVSHALLKSDSLPTACEMHLEVSLSRTETKSTSEKLT